MRYVTADLDRLPLATRVAQQMRDDIVSQSLEPGVRLSENVLVARYGVSRTPVREALRALESEGIIERTGPGSVAVPLMTREDAQHLYEACAVLEGLAARGVTKAFSPEVELAFSRCLREMSGAAAAGDRALILSIEADFHGIVGRYAGNTYLVRFLRSVATPLDRYRRFNEQNNPARATSAVFEHERLLKVFRSGDADAAQRATEAHVIDHLNVLLDHLPE